MTAHNKIRSEHNKIRSKHNKIRSKHNNFRAKVNKIVITLSKKCDENCTYTYNLYPMKGENQMKLNDKVYM